MSNGNDYQDSGFGALAGEGVENHYKVTNRISETGPDVIFSLPCDGCSRTLEIGVPWDELAVMANGLQPNGWIYERAAGGFMPNMTCTCRRARVRLGINPDEAGRYLKSLVAAGKVSMAEVQRLNQQIAARRGGG